MANSTRMCTNHFNGLTVFEKYIFGFQITHTTFSRIFEPCLSYKNWLSVTYPNENWELPECKKLHQFQNWSKQMEQSRLEFVPGIKNDEIEYYLLVYFLNSLQKWQLFIMTSKNLAFSTRVCKTHFSGLSIFEKYIFGIQITHTNQAHNIFTNFWAVSFKKWLSVTYPNENGELPECKKLHQFRNWSKQMEQSKLEFVPVKQIFLLSIIWHDLHFFELQL